MSEQSVKVSNLKPDRRLTVDVGVEVKQEMRACAEANGVSLGWLLKHAWEAFKVQLVEGRVRLSPPPKGDKICR